MFIRNLVLLIAIGGCTTIPSRVDPELMRVADVVLAEETVAPDGRVLHTAQPDPYAAIILQKYDEFGFEFESNLSELSLLRLRAQQGRLPQFSPTGAARTNGIISAELGIRQVLFAGSTFEAEFQNVDAELLTRQIALLDALNAEVSEDLRSYLDYHENIDRQALLDDVSSKLEALLDLARVRREGGLVTADEVALFELNLTEIQTEATIARSNAQIALADLDGLDVHQRPVGFFTDQEQLPIAILAALAERELARSELEVAEAALQPTVVFEGSGGFDLRGGTPVGNASIVVESEPRTFGGNTDVRLAEQSLRLSEYHLTETIADVERETTRIQMQIAALETQLAASGRLVEQANLRLNSFSNQFLAGSSTLSEAIGLIDTLRRSIDTQISTRYEISNLRRELAEELGHFWEF